MKIIKKEMFSIIVVTAYLIFYTITPFLNFSYTTTTILFIFSPFLLCWMVYSILKFGKPGRELKQDEEFGYLDKEEKDISN